MEQAKNSKEKWWWLAIIIVAAGGYWWWQHEKSAPEKAAAATAEPTLAAAMVQERDVMVSREYIGYVLPVNQVVVRPYISGFVDKVQVSGGQRVRAGDVLVTIEQSQYQALVSSAQAAVAQATADFHNAQSYYKRIRNAGNKAVSPTQTDSAKAQFLSAQAALAQAKANLQEAEVNYNYTLVKATIDGVIGHVELTPGDYISPQSALMTLISDDPMRVVFSLDDKDYLTEMKNGGDFADKTVRLRLADGTLYPTVGEFQYADNQVNRSTGSVAMYVNFANAERLLAANAYVTVLVEQKYRGVVVRKDLVALTPEQNYIYVANGENVSRAPVVVLTDFGNNYILQNDFKPGDKIVLGKAKVGAKYKIEVQEAEAAEEKR